jgi:DNA-binding response OmpR family regulator
MSEPHHTMSASQLPPERTPAAPEAQTMKHVLIIEDDVRITAALRVRFESQGYEVTTAPDAVVGLDLAVRRRPDLILLDISLPGGNGLALAQQLRSLPDTRKTPFIFVTASKDPALRRKAMELRAAGLFEKPYDAEELLDTARFALGDTMSFPVPKIVREGRDSMFAGTGAPRKILIVEDDEKIAMALALRLNSAGYETTTAGDAIAAVQAAAQLRPDLVLLDVSLPAGNGFAVAERLQTLLTKPTPVIFLTAGKQPALRQKAEAMRAAGFFEKPYEPGQLMASIQRAFCQ